MSTVTLPSGKVLEITPAPFKDAKRLYQAVAGQLFLRINFNPDDEMTNLIKNAICLSTSSPEIEAALEPCLRRCIYNKLKIVDSTFEAVEAREDYFDVAFEVARENVAPFTKSLFAQFKGLSAVLGKHFPASDASTTQRGSSTTSDSAPQGMET